VHQYIKHACTIMMMSELNITLHWTWQLWFHHHDINAQ